MNPTTRRHRLALAVLLPIATVALVSGCGEAGDGARISGTIRKGDAKYVPPTDQLVGVTLVLMEARDKAAKGAQSGDQFRAEYDPVESRFTVPGVEGRGIPPGKYRIAVIQKLKREAYNAANPKPKAKGPDREDDTLKNRFGLDTSPIIREISKSTDLEIDLDKPGGSGPTT